MKRLFVGLSLAGSMLITGGVNAQASGWYASLLAGQSKFDISGGDNKDNSHMLSVGYQFTPMISAEAGYIDYGKVLVGINAEAQSTHLSALFSAPLADKFSAYARLGVASTKTKASILGRFSNTERETEAVYGVGLRYQLSKSFDAVLDYNRLTQGDVESINLGFRLNF